MEQTANSGFPERSLYPEEILLIRNQSLRSDSDIRDMYQSKLAIDTDGVRARLEFLLRVWDSVIDGKYQNEMRGSSQDDRKYQEAFILATEIIPGRAAIGSFEPTVLEASDKEASAPPSLDVDSDGSTYYGPGSGPNTPSEDEGSPPNLSIDSDGSSYYACSSWTNTPSGQQPGFEDEVVSVSSSDAEAFTSQQGDDPLHMEPDSSYWGLLPEFPFHNLGYENFLPPAPLPSKVEEYLSPPVPTTLRPTGEACRKRKYDELEDTYAAISGDVKKARKEYGKDSEGVEEAAP